MGLVLAPLPAKNYKGSADLCETCLELYPFMICTHSALQTGARAPKTSSSKQLTRRMTALERTLHDIQASLERLEEEVEDISHAGPSFCLGR